MWCTQRFVFECSHTMFSHFALTHAPWVLFGDQCHRRGIELLSLSVPLQTFHMAAPEADRLALPWL